MNLGKSSPNTIRNLIYILRIDKHRPIVPSFLEDNSLKKLPKYRMIFPLYIHMRIKASVAQSSFQI